MEPIKLLLREILAGSGTRASLLRGGIASLALRAGGILAMMASSVVLARSLGPSEFGSYTLATSIMAMIAIPVHVGLPTLLLRETAKADVDHDLPRMKGVWIWSGRFVVGSSLIVMMVTYLLWWTVPGLVSTELAASLLLIPFIALGLLRAAALKGLRRVAWSMLPGGIIRPLLLTVFALPFMFWPSTEFNALAAIFCNIFASIIAFLFGALLLVRSRPAGMVQAAADFSKKARWLSDLAPIAMVGGLQVVNQNIGTVILGIVSTEEQVAQFRVAMSASTLLLLGLQVVTPPFEPYFVRAHRAGDLVSLQQVASRSALAGFIATVPIAVLFVAFGEWLLGALYGEGFAGGYDALLVLTIGQALRAYFGSSESILMLTGQERQGLVIWIAAIVLSGALAVPLSSEFGAVGAATAASLVLVVLRLLQWWTVRKRLRVDTSVLALPFKQIL